MNSDALPATPDAIPQCFVEAWNRRDADGIAALFEEDADFVNVTGIWWRKREDIRKAHAYGLKRIFQHSTLRVVETKVKHLSDDIAVVHAKMRLECQTPIGEVKAPAPRRNLFTFVVRKSGGAWLCTAAHNTDIIPGETYLRDEKGRLLPTTYRTTLGRKGPKT